MIFQKLFKKHSFYKLFNYIWILFPLFIVTGCTTEKTYYPPPVDRTNEEECFALIFCSDSYPLSDDQIVSLTVAASSPQELTFSVDEIVAQTVAASSPQQPTLSIDEIVAQTVAASSPQQPTLSIDEIVAQTVAASAPVAVVVTTAPDAAPDTNAPPVVADPNTASGTPQLRVSQNANVRKGPGTNYSVISSLSKDSVVNVVAKTQNDTWYIVELPGGSKGWIANSVTDPVNAADMAKVQVAATIPAPPTSTPTATATATTAATSTATTASGGHTPTPHGNSPTHTPTPAVTLISPTAVPSSIEVYNNSGTYICYVLTAASGENYGSNHLNGELAPGNSLYTTYPDAGPYELYAQECEGYDDLYWAKYNIFNDLYWELIPGGDEG